MAEPRKPRQHATEAAGKVPKMARDNITACLRAKEEGKPVAYAFISCNYDEIIRAMDITKKIRYSKFKSILPIDKDTYMKGVDLKYTNTSDPPIA